LAALTDEGTMREYVARKLVEVVKKPPVVVVAQAAGVDTGRVWPASQQEKDIDEAIINYAKDQARAHDPILADRIADPGSAIEASGWIRIFTERTQDLLKQNTDSKGDIMRAVLSGETEIQIERRVRRIVVNGLSVRQQTYYVGVVNSFTQAVVNELFNREKSILAEAQGKFAEARARAEERKQKVQYAKAKREKEAARLTREGKVSADQRIFWLNRSLMDAIQDVLSNDAIRQSFIPFVAEMLQEQIDAWISGLVQQQQRDTQQANIRRQEIEAQRRQAKSDQYQRGVITRRGIPFTVLNPQTVQEAVEQALILGVLPAKAATDHLTKAAIVFNESILADRMGVNRETFAFLAQRYGRAVVAQHRDRGLPDVISVVKAGTQAEIVKVLEDKKIPLYRYKNQEDLQALFARNNEPQTDARTIRRMLQGDLGTATANGIYLHEKIFAGDTQMTPAKIF